MSFLLRNETIDYHIVAGVVELAFRLVLQRCLSVLVMCLQVIYPISFVIEGGASVADSIICQVEVLPVA